MIPDRLSFGNSLKLDRLHRHYWNFSPSPTETRVGNRPSVTRHRPNRRPRFFDVVSSPLDPKGRKNENGPSETSSKNSHPISSSRSKTDETNRFRVDQIIVT